MSALQKYLRDGPQQRHAESESYSLQGFPEGFKHGLVVPVYRESIESVRRLCDFATQQPATLLILVLNRPEHCADTHWAEALFNSSLFSRHNLQWQADKQPLSLFRLDNGSSLMVVDRCLKGRPLPARQAVGLARKIGADILCSLINQHKVRSPWIANTDADALLPKNYFNALTYADSSGADLSAILFPYRHLFTDQTPPLPTLLYEFSLHYYVAGLSYAGSPYAYHTLGSTIAIHYQHYAKVRGFPKRSGAEDFYILNKLAKTGTIHTLQTPTIGIQARESTRVPFGTGPAVINLAAADNPRDMPLYHPLCFVYLRCCNQLLQQLAAVPEPLTQATERLTDDQKALIDKHILLNILEDMGIQDALTHSQKQGKDPASRGRHLQHWFDGFKTLRFIHRLRDQDFASISFQDWQNSRVRQSIPPTASMLELLERINTLP